MKSKFYFPENSSFVGFFLMIFKHEFSNSIDLFLFVVKTEFYILKSPSLFVCSFLFCFLFVCLLFVVFSFKHGFVIFSVINGHDKSKINVEFQENWVLIENLKVDMPILTCIFFTINWLTLTSEMHFVKFHPEVASCLLSRGKRKYAPLGMRVIWKYIRNYFLVYQLISHFLLYLQNYKE